MPWRLCIHVYIKDVFEKYPQNFLKAPLIYMMSIKDMVENIVHQLNDNVNTLDEDDNDKIYRK